MEYNFPFLLALLSVAVEKWQVPLVNRDHEKGRRDRHSYEWEWVCKEHTTLAHE
jgi:hypothetical protein